MNTKSPVGRCASGWSGTSPDKIGAGPGQGSVIAVLASGCGGHVRKRLVAGRQAGAIAVRRHGFGLCERCLGAGAEAIGRGVEHTALVPAVLGGK